MREVKTKLKKKENKKIKKRMVQSPKKGKNKIQLIIQPLIHPRERLRRATHELPTL